jgi:hypothetical protein
MIDPKELMIGNKVIASGLHEGRELTVEQIGSKGTLSDEFRVILFKEHIVGEFLRDVEPIPLTPSILQRYRFKMIQHNKDSGFKGFRLTIDPWYDITVWFELNKKPDTELNGVEVPCNSLHQLQNLTFALTGKPLIK